MIAIALLQPLIWKLVLENNRLATITTAISDEGRVRRMEMRSDGMCSILNDDFQEKKITDCRDCQLHCVVEDYRNRVYRMQKESEE